MVLFLRETFAAVRASLKAEDQTWTDTRAVLEEGLIKTKKEVDESLRAFNEEKDFYAAAVGVPALLSVRAGPRLPRCRGTPAGTPASAAPPPPLLSTAACAARAAFSAQPASRRRRVAPTSAAQFGSRCLCAREHELGRRARPGEGGGALRLVASASSLPKGAFFILFVIH